VAVASPQAVARLPGHTAEGLPVPLGQVARIEGGDGETLIARENGLRRLTVRCDIAGRAQGGFAAGAQGRCAEGVAPQVPTGYRVAWLGLFKDLKRAGRHFLLMVPVTAGLIFLLLLMTFGSLRAALVLLLSVPFALLGGVLALAVRGMTLNVSTGVG